MSERFDGFAPGPAVLAVVVVLVGVFWLQSIPPAAALPRFVSRALLVLALFAAVTAAFGPRAGRGWATLAAAVLIVLALAVAERPDAVSVLLLGAAVACGGLAFVGYGVSLITDGNVLPGAALIVLGAGATGAGIGWLAQRPLVFRISAGVLLLSTALVGAILMSRGLWLGLAIVAAVAGVPLAIRDRRWAVPLATVFGSGLLLNIGLYFIANGDVLTGAPVMILALPLAFSGYASYRGQQRSMAGSVVAGGVAVMVLGVCLVLATDLLLGIGFVGLGVVLIVSSLVELGQLGVVDQLRAWYQSITTVPDD